MHAQLVSAPSDRVKSNSGSVALGVDNLIVRYRLATFYRVNYLSRSIQRVGTYGQRNSSFMFHRYRGHFSLLELPLEEFLCCGVLCEDEQA